MQHFYCNIQKDIAFRESDIPGWKGLAEFKSGLFWNFSTLKMLLPIFLDINNFKKNYSLALLQN